MNQACRHRLSTATPITIAGEDVVELPFDPGVAEVTRTCVKTGDQTKNWVPSAMTTVHIIGTVSPVGDHPVHTWRIGKMRAD
ncbi:hypothetical protein ElyMa_004027400 [Elysia marginata]|uniref:Uncharacterized protein n=1 Tax=Elysia marginata TaxID=1093978 RepID=A0AAV4G1W2_9GAST|nr:hypothetical protein ElyMa_004027400 [Elysia marginata]